MSKIMLSLPDTLLKELDSHCEKFSFERSEFIRQLIRERIFGGIKADKIDEAANISDEKFNSAKKILSAIKPPIVSPRASSEVVIKKDKNLVPSGTKCRHGLMYHVGCHTV